MVDARKPTVSKPESINASGDKWLFVLAIALTAVSAVTTFAGMISILGGGSLGYGSYIVAAIVTLAVQILLTAISWILGRDLAAFIARDDHEIGARRTRMVTTVRYGAMSALLVFCFCFSVFFSFNTYFFSLYSGGEERRRAGELVPAFIDETTRSLERAIAAAEAGGVGALSGSLSKPWRDDLDRISKLAAESSARLEEIQRQRRAEEAARSARQVSEEQQAIERRREADRTVQQVVPRVEALERAIAEADKAIEALSPQLPGLEAEVARLKLEMESQARGTGNRQAGTGPLWRKAREDAEAAEEKLKKARSDLTSATQRRAVNEKLIGPLRDQVRDARVVLESVRTAPASHRTTPPPAPTTGAELAAEIAALGSAGPAFAAKPEFDVYERSVATCSNLMASIRRDSEAAGMAGNLSCASSTLVAAIRQEEARAAARAEFPRVCLGPSTNAALQFPQALTLTKECLQIASRAGAATGEAGDLIKSFETEHSQERSQIVKTLGAFGTARDIAFFALFLAALQDILVFLATFISDLVRLEKARAAADRRNRAAGIDFAIRVTDIPRVQALKAIHAGSATEDEENRDTYVYDLASERHLGLAEDIQSNIQSALRQMAIDRFAKARGTRYELNERAFRWIEDQILKLTPETATAGTGDAPNASQMAAAQVAPPAPQPAATIRLGPQPRRPKPGSVGPRVVAGVASPPTAGAAREARQGAGPISLDELRRRKAETPN